jgi:two-component system LytT family response regulator
MKVIIIEDEPLAREELVSQLSAFDDIEVVAECGDVFSAMIAIREHQPDVMFLDIILPGHDGFTLLDYMSEDEYRPHVVMVSGGPSDFAVSAFRKGVLDYLAKPVEDERLAETIERIRQQLSEPDSPALPYPDRVLGIIPCVFNRRIKFIKPEDIEFVKSDASGVHVICQDNVFYTELTLKTLLQKTELFQCHRQYLLTLNAVSEFEKLENGLAKIHTHSKKVVPVSRHFRKELELALGV